MVILLSLVWTSKLYTHVFTNIGSLTSLQKSHLMWSVGQQPVCPNLRITIIWLTAIYSRPSPPKVLPDWRLQVWGQQGQWEGQWQGHLQVGQGQNSTRHQKRRRRRHSNITPCRDEWARNKAKSKASKSQLSNNPNRCDIHQYFHPTFSYVAHNQCEYGQLLEVIWQARKVCCLVSRLEILVLSASVRGYCTNLSEGEVQHAMINGLNQI